MAKALALVDNKNAKRSSYRNNRTETDINSTTMLADGSLTIRYLHITNKGESIAGIGTGTT